MVYAHDARPIDNACVATREIPPRTPRSAGAVNVRIVDCARLRARATGYRGGAVDLNSSGPVEPEVPLYLPGSRRQGASNFAVASDLFVTGAAASLPDATVGAMPPVTRLLPIPLLMTAPWVTKVRRQQASLRAVPETACRITSKVFRSRLILLTMLM